jgi:alkylation response protein AidB-like acyl-CoA dehydrogenase
VLHFPPALAEEGVTIKDTWHALGMRSTGSNEDDRGVFVPEAPG